MQNARPVPDAFPRLLFPLAGLVIGRKMFSDPGLAKKPSYGTAAC